MLMSMTWAPFSTCWRATDSASSYCSLRIMRAKAFEPVTLVRSPTLTNSESSSIVNGSRPDRRSATGISGTARGVASTAGRDGLDVFRRGAAAAAGDVDEAGVGEFAQQGRGVFRQFVEAGVAHRVGQAGVRVDADEGVGDLRQFFRIRAHQGRAERAVQADGQRLRMAHRIPEGGHGLAGQDAARGVGDGAGDHQRQARGIRMLAEILVDREQRGLAVQRIEDGLDQQQVDAALDQAVTCSR
jgi:hypothetical protein